MLWVLLLVILLVAFFLYNYEIYKYWHKKGAKQATYFPILVAIVDGFFFRRHFYEMVTKSYWKFTDVRYIGLHQFTVSMLMLRDPKLIKQIGVKDFESFLDHRNFMPEDSDPLWSKILVNLKGQEWKYMRSALTPSFTKNKMKQMFALMNECVDNFLKHFTANSEEVQEVELKDIFTRYTNDIIATTVFGTHCDSLKDRENELYMRGKQSADFTGFWKSIRLMLTIMVPSIRKVIKASMFDEEVSTFFRRIVNEILEYREKNNIERLDMLNLLIHARKGTQIESEQDEVEDSNFIAVEKNLKAKNRRGKMDLSLDDITSQALVFFLGGFETVSTTMCFMGHELALHPEIQQKLIEELDGIRASVEEVSFEDLDKLTYLDMVVTETLRKWPPLVAVDRQCVKAYTIEPKHPDEKPVNLTPDDTIFIPIWAIHHDPKYWENPDKFDPERFSSENKHKITPYTYIPFGVGPRTCIGYRFGLMQVKAVFYTLLSEFEIVPIKKSSIPFVPNKRSFMNLDAAKGYWFGLKKRIKTEM